MSKRGDTVTIYVLLSRYICHTCSPCVSLSVANNVSRALQNSPATHGLELFRVVGAASSLSRSFSLTSPKVGARLTVFLRRNCFVRKQSTDERIDETRTLPIGCCLITSGVASKVTTDVRDPHCHLHPALDHSKKLEYCSP